VSDASLPLAGLAVLQGPLGYAPARVQALAAGGVIEAP
jgi:hypothetical protein